MNPSTENHNQLKSRFIVLSHNECICKTTSVSKASWTLQEWTERCNELREQNIDCETAFPRDIRNCTHKAQPTWIPKHDLKMDGNKRHDKVVMGKITRAESYKRNYRQLRNSDIRELVFPKKYHINWLPKQNSQPWKYMYTSKHILSKLYFRIRIYMSLHISIYL